MHNARAGHTATTFADGRIVFAGGDNSGTIEIYEWLDERFHFPFRNSHNSARISRGRPS
jgi:hypothetical protein